VFESGGIVREVNSSYHPEDASIQTRSALGEAARSKSYLSTAVPREKEGIVTLGFLVTLGEVAHHIILLVGFVADNTGIGNI
jgi:hypothetical protein